MFPGASLEESHTVALKPSEVTSRMLSNLKQIHLSNGDLGATIDVAQIGVELPDASVATRVELATMLASAGRYEKAAEQHERLQLLDAKHAEQHRNAVQRLRAHQN